MTEEKERVNPEALKSLSAKYENVLEAHIKILYMKIVQFIAASQLPLVHVNAVLDLVKRDLLEQLKDGYFPEKK
jgi:hypothetical protein